MMTEEKIDLAEFKKYYLEEGHTQSECAVHFGCSKRHIENFKFRYGIHRHLKNDKKPDKIDRKVLERLYIQENRSRKECAEILGCTESRVRRYLFKHNIKKDPIQAAKKRTEYNLSHYGVACTLCDEKVKAKRDKTWESKYGGNPSKSPEIAAKRAKTISEKYGAPNYNQCHLPETTISIVSDKEKLKDFIKNSPEKDTFSLARRLGYKDHNSIITIIHKFGLEEYVSWWRGGASHYEKEIRRWLKEKGYNFYHTRTVIPPQELDLYNKEHRVAIEFNGSYWHSKLPKTYHLEKSIACEKKNVRLIHIWEHEWNNPTQQAVLKNIILSALKDPSLKPIFARKCSVEVRPSREMRDFFNQNNIQGFRGGKFAICLVYNKEVIMSYMMGRCHFTKGKYDWEVIRGATKLGYYVIGGASKLWKFFVKNYNPRNCVYYVDFNQFNGHSVEKLGFKYLCTRISFRNYWVREKKVTNRNPSHHKEIKALMEQGLVFPLYNAGVKTYVWGKPNF